MKIMVVDDHILFRDGLKYVLDALGDDISILEAGSSDASIPLLKANPDIDLLLVDLNMPGKGGLAVLKECRTKYSMIPVVIVSASKRKQDIQQAMNMGAMGYISKDINSRLMINILQLVLSGGLYFPQIVSSDDKALFTPRQRDVLELIVEGCSNKVIAAKMSISEATIKMHVTAIFKILEVTNRTQAAMTTKENGLLLGN
jgi:DNA-binding NarL/FixJ family response regulator